MTIGKLRQKIPVQILISTSLTNPQPGASKFEQWQNESMVRSQNHKLMSGPRRRRKNSKAIAARAFQYRYSFFLGSFGFILALIVGGITLYLLNHNYQMFARAEMITSPKVVDNLYRELKLANELITVSLLAFVIFLALMGVRLSQRIVLPIMLVQEKMRGICKGDLKRARVFFRKGDEFQEFGETYNYMVESLKIQVKCDLEKLASLKPDEHNRDAIHIWGQMIDEKMAQLSAPPSALIDPTGVSHHVS
jgi:methyl-accepting chemotaxis protein